MARRKTPPERLNHQAWPTVDEALLAGKEKVRYVRLAEAVRAACNGMPSGQIEVRFGVPRSLLNYYIKRCTETHPDGRLRGFRALVKCGKREGYVRVAPVTPGERGGGYAGAFTMLLQECPKSAQWLNKRNAPGQGGLNLAQIHVEFLDQLRKEGRKPDQYPFNTSAHRQGYYALCAYVRRRIAEGDDQAARARYGDEAVQAPGRNSGKHGLFTPNVSYARCAYDEWKLPSIGTVTIEVEGKEVVIPLERVWLCPIVCFRSNAILGYDVSLPASFGTIQLLRAFETTIKAPQRIVHEAFKDLAPLVDEGLPASVVPSAHGRRIAVLIVDNHLTHLADRVVDDLRERTGVSISFGKVRSWIQRFVVEGLFSEFQAKIRLLASTTGSGPGDPAFSDPVGNAISYDITLDGLLALIDQLVCRHNASRRLALMTATSNEIIARDWAEDARHSILPTHSPSLIEQPLIAVETEYVTVRGARSKDRTPYIEIDDAEYTSDLLKKSWSMVGEKLKVVIWGDCRSVLAYRLDGSEFGILACSGHWARTPHTRATRKEIISLHAKGLLDKRSKDPVTHYVSGLARSAAAKVAGKRRTKIPQEGRKLVQAMSVPGGPADPPGFTHPPLKMPRPPSKDYAKPSNRGSFFSRGTDE